MIADQIQTGLDLLFELDTVDAVTMFLFFLLFDLPRYGLTVVVVGAMHVRRSFRRAVPSQTLARVADDHPLVSVVIAGHNEENAIEACVRSLREQSLMHAAPGSIELVVIDDGSTDLMRAVASRLEKEGVIAKAISLDVRGGKSAAINLGISVCRAPFIAIVDADCSFDRDAIEKILAYFDDPAVGAVGGNIGLRNADVSLTTRAQAIEYLLSIGMGRQASDAFGTLTIVSGAFGVFRREALESVGGYDVEVGEDADLTLKLRRAGWRIRFAADAWCLTDVPDNLPALFSQRMRWDRGAIALWARKHRGVFNPFRIGFAWRDVVGSLDPLLFDVGLSAVFVGYLGWLFWSFGSFAWVLLVAIFPIYLIVGLVSLLAATIVSARPNQIGLLPYLPVYVLLGGFLMRFLRLVAVFGEIALRSSYRDPYVPRRVMDQVDIT